MSDRMLVSHQNSSNTTSANMSEKTIWFEVVLHCTKTGQTDHKTITFPSCPLSIYDVKLQVEKQYNIPACTQVLTYETFPMEDKVKLKAVRVRNGDTFHISYLAEGHCAEIIEIISWMGLALALLRHENPSVSEGITASLNDFVSFGIQEEMIEDLAFKYFFPWLDPVKYVNKLHFVYNGGVDIIMEVYGALLRQPWEECVFKLKYVEYGILRVLWNLTETFPLRRLVTQNKGIQMCIQSMLRVRLEEGKKIEDFEPLANPIQKTLLVETIVAGLGTLCKYVVYIFFHRIIVMCMSIAIVTLDYSLDYFWGVFELWVNTYVNMTAF